MLATCWRVAALLVASSSRKLPELGGESMELGGESTYGKPLHTGPPWGGDRYVTRHGGARTKKGSKKGVFNTV